jgi:ubiquinone/menaquinone biosynthesis C-methylase UbiE
LAQDKIVQGVGAFVMTAGPVAVLADLAIYPAGFEATGLFLMFGLLLGVLGYAMVMGLNLNSFKVGFGKDRSVALDFAPRSAPDLIQQRKLDEQEKSHKEAYKNEVQKDHPLPGQNAPQFSSLALSKAEDILVRPSAYPMTPMYMLDNNFRIIDWNQAFTIAFDRTMEGRTGSSVLEWTYFLDNFQEVLDHGMQKFGRANALPQIDVEEIQYTSQRYGPLSATKRAYQIPDDDNTCLAWLITLDLKFADVRKQNDFHQDLLRMLAWDLMWSEYATSYDRVLTKTRVYPQLLNKLIGGYDGVRAISADARIIDLGAGTGNVTNQLITTGGDRLIYALENNRLMLQFLQAKCQKFLKTNGDAGGGVIAIKQDITSLYGLDDNYFDFAIMNNVLYSVPDVDACLKETHRVLKRGGELRLSGPRKDTKLKVLFDRIKRELKDAGVYEEVEADYKRVLEINERRLSPSFVWSTKDVEAMLLRAGFAKIIHSSEDIYAGQSMFICAVK